jgi:hypothetical protein
VTLGESYANQGSIGKGCRGRKNIQKCLTLLLVLLGMVSLVSAQEQPQTQKKSTAPPDIPVASQQVISELAKDNYDRVAASPGQLKTVFVQDTGLLVELKRWIAKEASDNGQIVSDEDLTDAAVFQRLNNDIKFRAVATRLVQKYGYLRPTVNPDSEMGKQQTLVLQERAKKIVQIQAEEDAEEAAIKKQQRQNIRLVPCPLGEDETPTDNLDCYDYFGTSRTRGGVNQPGTTNPRDFQQPYPPSDQSYPPYPSSPILRAQNDGTGSDLGVSGQDSSASQRLADLMVSGGLTGDTSSLVGGMGGGVGGGATSTDQLDLTSMDPRRLQALQALQNGGASQQDLSALNTGRSDI